MVGQTTHGPLVSVALSEEVREYVRAVCACRDENLAIIQGSPRGALELFDNLIKEKKRLIQVKRLEGVCDRAFSCQDIRNCRLFDRERKPVLSKVVGLVVEMLRIVCWYQLRAEIESHGLYLAAPKRARLMNLTIPHKPGVCLEGILSCSLVSDRTPRSP